MWQDGGLKLQWLPVVVHGGDDRVDSVGSDTAVVLLVSGHLDVTVVSPGLRPGVLHEVVVFAILQMPL